MTQLVLESKFFTLLWLLFHFLLEFRIGRNGDLSLSYDFEKIPKILKKHPKSWKNPQHLEKKPKISDPPTYEIRDQRIPLRSIVPCRYAVKTFLAERGAILL